MTTCRDRRRSSTLAPALAAAAFTLALSAIAPLARAQSEDQAAARALFEEGRRLMKAKQYAAACPKLEAARELYSSAGILLNLADCHEKTGRTASAWTEFGEAATVAARTNRAGDAEEGRRRQAALLPSLARIVIRVPHPVSGQVVQRDGSILAAAAWGAALPVDPGSHAITAEAPGYDSWTASVTVLKPGQVATIDVPALRAVAVALPATPAPSSTIEKERDVKPPERISEAPVVTTNAGSGRALAWVLVGVGAAVAVGGGALMLVESGRASRARDDHDPAAYDATRTPWTIGLVGAIVGVAGVAAGTALVAIGPGEGPSRAVSLSAWFGGSQVGMTLAKSW